VGLVAHRGPRPQGDKGAVPDKWSAGIDDLHFFIFVDLDGCRNPKTGAPREWSPELRRKAPDLPEPIDIIVTLDSYVEISPSGTGYHVFCRGKLPPGGRRIGGKGSGCPDGIEMYDQGRYATVTGLVASPDCPAEPRECTEELNRLHQAAFGQNSELKQPAKTRPEEYLSDREIVERASRAANGDRFQKLWAGDPSDYPSPSEADLAMASMLAFWTGPRPDTIETIMRKSGLLREKWDREDYLQRTIGKAMEGRSESWEASRSATPQAPATDAPAPTKDFPLTDSGNAERFAAQHGGDVRYCHPWQKWLVWDGRRWNIDDTAAVERLAKATVRKMFHDASTIEDDTLRKAIVNHARASESASRRAAMLRLAQSEQPIPIRPAAWTPTRGCSTARTGRSTCGRANSESTVVRTSSRRWLR